MIKIRYSYQRQEDRRVTNQLELAARKLASMSDASLQFLDDQHHAPEYIPMQRMGNGSVNSAPMSVCILNLV